MVIEAKETVETPESEVNTGVQAEEVKESPKEEAITFKTKAELSAHVQKEAERLANSIANKSTGKYQTEVNDLKAKLKEAERKTTEKQEDDAYAKLDKLQKEEWGETPEVGDFQEAVKKLRTDVRKFKQEQGDWAERHEIATKGIKEYNALMKGLELYLDQESAEEFLPTLKAFVKKVAEAGTDREADLLYALEQARLKELVEAEEKPKRTKPDSNLPSAPGGKDWGKASAEEKIAQGLQEERKKYNIK